MRRPTAVKVRSQPLPSPPLPKSKQTVKKPSQAADPESGNDADVTLVADASASNAKAAKASRAAPKPKKAPAKLGKASQDKKAAPKPRKPKAASPGEPDLPKRRPGRPCKESPTDA